MQERYKYLGIDLQNFVHRGFNMNLLMITPLILPHSEKNMFILAEIMFNIMGVVFKYERLVMKSLLIWNYLPNYK